MACLVQLAQQDPLAWLPAVGWVRLGEPYGLALAVFGPSPSDSQLRALAKMLFRLANDGTIDVAVFRRPRSSRSRLRYPVGAGNFPQAGLVGPGSQPLHSGGPNEYGVRLRC